MTQDLRLDPNLTPEQIYNATEYVMTHVLEQSLGTNSEEIFAALDQIQIDVCTKFPPFSMDDSRKLITQVALTVMMGML